MMFLKSSKISMDPIETIPPRKTCEQKCNYHIPSHLLSLAQDDLLSCSMIAGFIMDLKLGK